MPQHFTLYVPRVAEVTSIDARSAVVGTPAKDYFPDLLGFGGADEIVVDFEGNRYGATNMVTYADRASHAAGRHQVHYPTVARLVVKAAQLIRVGSFDFRNERVHVDDRDALTAWLGDFDDAELYGTSVRATRP